MRESLCICALIEPRDTRTRLLLFIHREEDRKSTNTGRLATRCLRNSRVVVRGHEGEATAPFTGEPGYQPLLLFPHPGAMSLAHWRGSTRPIALIVPDGNWRQAAKVRNRVPGLSELPCVTLPLGEPSSYRLRLEAHPTGLATFEAVARAMGILEGEEVERALTYVFRAMVERTLWSRGTVGREDVESGVPDVADGERRRSGHQANPDAKVAR